MSSFEDDLWRVTGNGKECAMPKSSSEAFQFIANTPAWARRWWTEVGKEEERVRVREAIDEELRVAEGNYKDAEDSGDVELAYAWAKVKTVLKALEDKLGLVGEAKR